MSDSDSDSDADADSDTQIAPEYTPATAAYAPKSPVEKRTRGCGGNVTAAKWAAQFPDGMIAQCNDMHCKCGQW